MTAYRASAAGGGTTGTSNRTLTLTPAVGDLIVVFVSLSANTNTSMTMTDDQGGTYYLVGTALWGSSANIGACFVREQIVASAVSTVITCTSGSNTAGELVAILCSGSARVGQAAVRSFGSQADQSASTTPAPALNQNALTGNMTLAAVASGDTTTSPNASWTERQDASQSSPVTALEVSTRDSGFTSTTITFGATCSTTFASFALELDGSMTGVGAAAGTSTPTATGTAITAAVGVAAGTSDATAVGIGATTAVGSAAGTGTATGVASGPGGIMPSIYEDGAAVHGTGDLTVNWGTHNDTFYGVIVVQSNGQQISTPTGTGQTWTLIDEAYEGTPGAAGSVGIAVFYCKATSGSMSAVTVPDTGDHTSAKMWMIKDVVQSGNPINFSDTQTVGTATASISFACPSSTVTNCLVFIVCAHGIDSSSNQGGSGWTNSSLANVGLAGQFSTDNGNGGGYMGGVGEKASVGACGTFAHTWAGGATKQANIIFAISNNATVQDTGAGSAAGTSTPTAVGASVAAAAGSAAGTSTVTGEGAEDGNVGDADGTSTATGVGASVATAAGSAAGTSGVQASSVEHRLIEVTTSPQTFANGTWSVGAFEAKWKIQLTMTFASGNAAYDSFHGIVTSGALSGFGLWLVDRNFEIYDTNDIQLLSVASTWSAGQNITLMPDFVNGTLTISGATTGNGVHNFTPSAPHWESGSSLYVCKWGSGSTYDLAATTGSIYAVVTAGAGSAAGTSTPTATGASTAAAAGSAAGTSTVSGVGQESNPDFELGAVVSARLLFGSAQTSVTTAAVDTQTSGSTIVICTGGLLTDLATAPTDNKSNTYTALGSAEEFSDWAGYGIRMWKCIGATGGSGHTFTQTQTAFEEVTIVVVEITDASWIEDDSIIERADATTVTSADVTSLAECHLITFWSGDAPTGQTAVLDPPDGTTVEDDATLEDHLNGYVPIAALHSYKSAAGTFSTLIGHTPTQGAILAAAVVQRAHIASGAGSAAGTSTPTATGASTAVADGSSAGTSTPTATGASTATAAGSAAGTSAADAAGVAAAVGVGDAAGTSDGSAIGAATATGSGSATGTSTPAATGTSTATAAGSSSGAGDAAGVGASVAAADGSAAGSSTPTAVGASVATGAGSAGGTSDPTAAGTAVVGGAGASSGTSGVAAVGSATASGVGASAGVGTAAGTAPGTSDAEGSAAGTGDAAAVGTAIVGAVGSASGVGAAAATGTAITPAVGAASGTSTAAADGNAPSSGVGSAGGSGDATAVGVAIAQGAGTAEGTGSASATGASTATATGFAAGTSTATGISPSQVNLPAVIRVRVANVSLRVRTTNTELRVRNKSSTLRVRLKG